MKIFKLCIVCVIAGCFCLAAAAVSVSEQQQALSSKLIRLHVIAASNDDADQTRKLLVRDAVLSEINRQSCNSREAMIAWLGENLHLLADVSQFVLEQNGSVEPVSVSLGHEIYPTRYYESFTLPAGDYISLKITIGEGTGKNWWCVVYPAICMPGASDSFTATAVSAGLTSSEITLITEDAADIKIKFKLLELLNFLKKS